MGRCLQATIIMNWICALHLVCQYYCHLPPPADSHWSYLDVRKFGCCSYK